MVHLTSRTVAVCIAALLGMALPPIAVAGDERDPLPPSFDAEPAGPPFRTGEEHDLAVAAFRAIHGLEWKIRPDRESGLPRTITGGTTSPYGATPEEACLAFIQEHREFLGLPTDPSTTLKHVRTQGSLSGNPVQNIVLWRQEYRDLPVHDSELRIWVDREGCIHRANCAVWPTGDVEIAPFLSADEAFTIAAADALPYVLGDREALAGSRRERWREPVLGVFKQGEGRLAYEIHALARAPDSRDFALHWIYWIDAHNGDVLAALKRGESRPAPKAGSADPVGAGAPEVRRPAERGFCSIAGKTVVARGSQG